MIKLDKPTTLLELVILSGHIKDEQPVSLLVTAPPEAGKTELIMKFAQNDGCVALTDCTAYGISHYYGQAIRDRKIRHLIIPDLVKPLSRGKDTVHSLIAFLNSLVEEGVFRVSTYAEQIGAPLGKDNSLEQVEPVKCGLIASLAKDVLLDGRHQWSRMGFMSRMLPISYDYNSASEFEIRKSIAKREYIAEEQIKLAIPDSDREIQLESTQADELMMLSTTLANSKATNSTEKRYGFRLQKHIQRLAMASALRENRATVQPKDVELIKDLSSCINLEYCPL